MKSKVGLIGFGKTGRAIANVLLQNDQYSLAWILKRKKNLHEHSAADFLGIESSEPSTIYSSESIEVKNLINENPVDVIIDFSSNEGIYTYGEIAANKRITVISAISHYSENEKNFLKLLAEKTTIFWSPNITLGVNFLMFAAKLLKKIAPWTDIEIIEEHFKGKKGVSGTAAKLARSLKIDEEQVNSIRVGGIVGKHEVIFGFPFQTVRLTHESISREAFGTGIIFVADHIKSKSAGFYTFEDLLKPYFTIN